MKRRVLILGLFLLLGAVANVAVAWGCAALLTSELGPIRRFDEVYDRAVFERIWPRSYGGTDNMFMTQSEGIGQSTFYITSVSSEGRWISSEVAAGWPIHALRGHYSSGSDKSYPQTDTLIWHPAIPWLGERVLPYGIILRGFAINTIFYAALLWLLFWAVTALRRRRRIKRGLCPACAYPVGTSPVCTECGKPVTPRPPEPGTRNPEG